MAAKVLVDVAQFAAPSFDPVRWVQAMLDKVPATASTNASSPVVDVGEGSSSSDSAATPLSSSQPQLQGYPPPPPPQQQQQEPLEQFATQLVMQLQLLSQDVAAQLDEATEGALRKIPRVMHDLELVKKDAQAMKDTVDLARGNLEAFEQKTDSSVRTLITLDLVKTRMEESRRALQEADNWNTFTDEMEGILASGDFQKAADKLHEMERSLPVLKNMPSYESHAQLLAQAQTRFQGLISPQVLTALSERDTFKCKELLRIFTDTNRLDDFKRYYLKSRQVPLIRTWTDVKSSDTNQLGRAKAIVARLEAFYSVFVSALAKEYEWAHQLWGGDDGAFAANVSSLVQHALSSLEPSFSNLLQNLRAGLKPEDQLLILTSITNHTRAFIHGVDEAFGQKLSILDLASILSQIVEHITTWQKDYASLHKAYMLAQLQGGTQWPTSLLDESQQSAISDSLTRWTAVFAASPESFLQLSHGLSVVGFGEAVRASVDVSLGRLKEFVGSMRSVHKLDPSSAAAPAAAAAATAESTDDDWALVQGAVGLLSLTTDYAQSLRSLWVTVGVKLGQNAVLLSAIGRVGIAWSPTSGVDRAELVLLQSLAKVLPQDQVTLATELAQKQQPIPPIKSFDGMGASVDGAVQLVQKFLFDSMFHIVERKLAGVAVLPVWSNASAGTGKPSVAKERGVGLEALPLFSLSPSKYITQIGEHLLMLPQQLEPFADESALGVNVDTIPFFSDNSGGGEGGGDVEASPALSSSASIGDTSVEFLDVWVASVARGTSHALVAELAKIPMLSEYGRQQLLTDLKYISNVLAALDVRPAPALPALAHFLQLAGADLAKTTLATVEPHGALFIKVAAMRGVQLQ